MIDQQLSGLRESFLQLIPSCTSTCGYALERQLESWFGEAFLENRDCGIVFREDTATIWMTVPPRRYGIISLKREQLAFSRSECEFLNYFKSAARGLLIQSDVRNVKTTGRIASRYSFEHVLVTRYLHRKRSGTVWTAALAISQLQELSFQKYEGQPCTSGFVFFSEPAQQIADLAPEYRFQPFEGSIKLNETFFRTPAAYRYVDGRNAFYTVDHVQNVFGVTRLREPTAYGRVARSAHDHIKPLLGERLGRAWAVCSSRPHELEAIARSGRHLRWSKSHWHFVDRSILLDV